MDEFSNKHIYPYEEKNIEILEKAKSGLPFYTKQEELANTISHMTGIFIGLGVIVSTAFYHHSEYGLIGGLIFGSSLIILYLASSIYHGTPRENVREKKLFRLFDHCSIFVLIGGTCTPFMLDMIHQSTVRLEWMFYGIIWGLAISGIALLCVSIKKYKSMASIMYVVMGLLLVLRAHDFSRIIGDIGLALLLAGSVVYLIGFLFYGLGSKRKWMHTVFHGLCLVGSVLHSICICGYAI